jgi:hypothetical protein
MEQVIWLVFLGAFAVVFLVAKSLGAPRRGRPPRWTSSDSSLGASPPIDDGSASLIAATLAQDPSPHHDHHHGHHGHHGHHHHDTTPTVDTSSHHGGFDGGHHGGGFDGGGGHHGH